MNTRNRSESKNKQRTVDEIIDKIKEKTADGDYVSSAVNLNAMKKYPHTFIVNLRRSEC